MKSSLFISHSDSSNIYIYEIFKFTNNDAIKSNKVIKRDYESWFWLSIFNLCSFYHKYSIEFNSLEYIPCPSNREREVPSRLSFYGYQEFEQVCSTFHRTIWNILVTPVFTSFETCPTINRTNSLFNSFETLVSSAFAWNLNLEKKVLI